MRSLKENCLHSFTFGTYKEKEKGLVLSNPFLKFDMLRSPNQIHQRT